MLVKNTYHKRISFVINEKSIGIDSNQTITVDKEIGKKLLESPWITDNLAEKCSECSQGKKIAESPKAPDAPKVLYTKEAPNIKYEKKTNSFGSDIKKKIEIKKVDKENN